MKINTNEPCGFHVHDDNGDSLAYFRKESDANLFMDASKMNGKQSVKVYRKIALTYGALQNCRNSGNTEWEEKHTETLEAIADNILPRGSGCDSGTTIDLLNSKPERIILHTSFHHMDEYGGYDDWTEHDVIITPSLQFNFHLRITGRNRNDIKDYMHETFTCLLHDEYVNEQERTN